MGLIHSDPNRVITERLVLIPLSLELVSLLQSDTRQAAARMGANVPEDWLSPDLRDYLPLYRQIVEKDPEAAVWGIWTMVRREEPRIVGDIGFKGRPDTSGAVDIGYGVRAEHEGKGYATEAARGLIAWAFTQPSVRRVTADCLASNAASIRVLEKAGMRRLGLRPDGLIGWERPRPGLPGSITRLNHVMVTIPVGAEAEARRFYSEVLGLLEIPKPDSLGGRGGFWLAVGDQQVHVGVEDGINRAATRAHFAYQVTDLAAWRKWLDQHSVPMLESIPIPGFDRLECRDPFGNRIELIQPLG